MVKAIETGVENCN